MRSTLMRWAYRLLQVQWRVTWPLVVGVRVLLIQEGGFDINALPPDASPATRRRIHEYRSGAGPFSGKW